MRFSLNFVKEFVEVPCDARELADRLTMVGMEVEHIEPCGDDWAFDIEVTSNRYDWLSIVGIAREVAACCNTRVKIAYPAMPRKPLLVAHRIVIESECDCSLYIARRIGNVAVKDAPAYMRARLTACGVSSINNVVDITNYCMLVWGNPLHAFDADKIEGDIHVRRARPGEQFVGIDGKARALSQENLVIADAKKVVALAGVMGAKNTEVDAGTKNILLEAAVFSPILVRRSRRAAGLDTDSSYRFERRVLDEYVGYASAHAARLIAECAGGSLTGFCQAGRLKPSRRRTIAVRFSALNEYLGDEFPKAKVVRILSSLGFTVEKKNADTINLGVPGFRLDVERDVDVYEEFIRVFGYGNIRDRLPHLARVSAPGTLYHFKNSVKHCLARLGFREIITYSIEAQRRLAALGETSVITLSNPLREQENALRPTLLTGSLDALRHNLNRGQDDVRFFELANVYQRQDAGFIEKPMLALALCRGEDDFAFLKGVVESLLHQQSVPYAVRKQRFPNFTNALVIVSGDVEVGLLGRVDRKVTELFDIKEKVFFAHLDVAALARQVVPKRYQPFSPYPAVWRDISILYHESIAFKDLEQCIVTDTPFLTHLAVVDMYRGKDIPAQHAALTVRVFYQSAERTLTSEEVDASQSAIRQRLAQKQGVVLR